MLRNYINRYRLSRMHLVAVASLIALVTLLPPHEWMYHVDRSVIPVRNVVAIDQRRHDAADLVFKVDQLRRTIISVNGVVSCQSIRSCVLELPAPMDDMISVGLQNLATEVQRRIVLSQPKDACPAWLTGFFDGVHLELAAVEFSPDPECNGGPRRDSQSSYSLSVPIG